MTRKETGEILTIIQTAYPRFYQTTQSSDLSRTLDLWAEMFKDDKVQIVALAVKSLIKNLEFPPTIADVKKEMEKIVDVATDKPSAIDEWNLIRKALGNSIYHAEENFEALPPIAKKFVGSPKQLRDWATSTDFNDGVVRGQFLKQYEVLEKREKYRASMTPELKNLIDKAGFKMLEGGEA